MNSKEAYRPVRSVEGVVKQNDLNFIRFILPGEDFHLEVLKNEGDYINALDPDSKLPKGYSLVRVSTEGKSVGEFGVNLKNLEPEKSRIPIYASGDIPRSSPGVVLDPVKPSTVEETRPNPAAFRQEPQEKACNSDQNPVKEKIKVSNNVPQTDKEDSRGYFKALNLNATELAGLTSEVAGKKIKSNYRAAATRAHPDHGGSHDAMVKVNLAMEVISNPGLRSAYQSWTGQFAPQARP
jgi:hypothetical protein